MDVTELNSAWNISWPGCPPVAHLLRHRFPGRSARFRTLPAAKRYATLEAEHAEIQRRHHVLLAALLGNASRGDGVLVAITCSWSATPQPTARDAAVAAIAPEAVHWRSDDLAAEPGYHSWQHHHVSRTSLRDPALDRLLRCVAEDLTDGVVLTSDTCAWAVHPYDGGADVFAASTQARDRLSAAYADWLAPTTQAT